MNLRDADGTRKRRRVRYVRITSIYGVDVASKLSRGKWLWGREQKKNETHPLVNTPPSLLLTTPAIEPRRCSADPTTGGSFCFGGLDFGLVSIAKVEELVVVAFSRS